MRVHRLDPVQQARSNMVFAQLKANGVVDKRVLHAIDYVSREKFVPVSASACAYRDGPVACAVPGRYLFAPQTLGLFLQNLNLLPCDKVLVVGGNYGYTAAVLFELRCVVYVIESESMLVAKCREKLKKYSPVIENGPLNLGLPEHGAYRAIIIEVGLAALPITLIDQLEEGGRIAVCIANDKAKLSKGHVFEKKSEKLQELLTFEADMPLYNTVDTLLSFEL